MKLIIFMLLILAFGTSCNKTAKNAEPIDGPSHDCVVSVVTAVMGGYYQTGKWIENRDGLLRIVPGLALADGWRESTNVSWTIAPKPPPLTSEFVSVTVRGYDEKGNEFAAQMSATGLRPKIDWFMIPKTILENGKVGLPDESSLTIALAQAAHASFEQGERLDFQEVAREAAQYVPSLGPIPPELLLEYSRRCTYRIAVQTFLDVQGKEGTYSFNLSEGPDSPMTFRSSRDP